VRYSLSFLVLDVRGLLECTQIFSSFEGSSIAPLVVVVLLPLVLFGAMMIISLCQVVFADFARDHRSSVEKERLLVQHHDDEASASSASVVEDLQEDEPALHHTPFVPSFQDRLVNIFLRLSYQAFFEITATLVLALHCVKDDFGGSWSAQWPWKACTSSFRSSTFPIVISFLILYGLGVPLLFIGTLWRNRSRKGRVRELRVRYFLSFIYENYRTSAEWFEATNLCRAILLALAAGLAPTEWRSLLISFVLLGSIFLLLVIRPYRADVELWIEVGALTILAITQTQLPVFLSLHRFRQGLFSIIVALNGAFVLITTVVLFHALFKVIVAKR
jgi:hypothetical protein